MSFQVPGLASRRVPTCGVVCGTPLFSFGVKSGLTTVIDGPDPGTGAKTTGPANALWLTPVIPRRDNADTAATITGLANLERFGTRPPDLDMLIWAKLRSKVLNHEEWRHSNTATVRRPCG